MVECVVLYNIPKNELYVDNDTNKRLKTFEELKDLQRNADSYGAFMSPAGRITNLRIFNAPKSQDTYEPLCAIMALGPLEVEYVKFQYFRNSIVWVSHYSDLKKVSRCSFLDPKGQTKSDYSVDFGGLGDALIFRGNNFGNNSSSSGPNALRLNKCGGGEVCGNIINGDVLIRYSRAVTYANNHMENGAQLGIVASNVTVDSNFLEKGSRPPIMISSGDFSDESIVSLRNNAYIYYATGSRSLIPGQLIGGNEPDKTAVPPLVPSNLSQISDYDIVVRPGDKPENMAPRCVLSISNEFRYWTAPGLASKMYTCGICMGKESQSSKSISPVEDFNSKSHILSRESRLIFAGGEVRISYLPVTIGPGLNLTSIVWPTEKIDGKDIIKHNSGVKWFGELDATYVYYYQIIWSNQSKMVVPAPVSGKLTPSAPYTPYYVLDKEGNFSEGPYGCYATIHNGSACGDSAMVRFIRERISGGATEPKILYADVPLVDCYMIYDNGTAIGTYKWKKAEDITGSSTALPVITGTVPSSKLTITFINNKEERETT